MNDCNLIALCMSLSLSRSFIYKEEITRVERARAGPRLMSFARILIGSLNSSKCQVKCVYYLFLLEIDDIL